MSAHSARSDSAIGGARGWPLVIANSLKFLDGPKIQTHIQREMRFAIFGDIHANLEAFDAVLADAREEGCDRNICLGDIVGYNADPNACLDKVRELNCPIVKATTTITHLV